MPTSADGKITAYPDTANAGMLLKGDFSSLSTKPNRIRFYRDGQLVRSGDVAWAPGGIGVAYDHEMTLGDAHSWTAAPVFADGSSGAASQAVTVTVPAMDAAVDCWIKPLYAPSEAVSFPVHTDRIEEAWSDRAVSYAVPGRRYPVGGWDVRTPDPISITLRTVTKQQKDDLNTALDQGPVLVQLRSSFGVDDFYAIPGKTTARYFVGMFSPLRDMPTVFAPCDRPPTLDAPLMIPGRSYAEQQAAAPTYADRLSTWPTHGNAIGLP